MIIFCRTDLRGSHIGQTCGKIGRCDRVKANKDQNRRAKRRGRGN